MEKGTKIGLMVVLIIFLYYLPSAHALNCTKFTGDERSLCGTINPLPVTESYKRQLMRSDLYNTNVIVSNEPINLSLNLDEQEQTTLNKVYDENIIIIGSLLTFIFVNYSILSILTKSFNIIKWLVVVS